MNKRHYIIKIFALTIYADDTLKLVFFNGNIRVEAQGLKMLDVGTNGGKCLEYGTQNVKTSIPFKKYTDGTLNERWTQIK